MTDTDKAYIPIGFCPHCNEYMPIQIDKLVHKKRNLTMEIGHCPKCDYVLNLEKDFELRWVTEKEIIEMGWKPENIQEKK